MVLNKNNKLKEVIKIGVNNSQESNMLDKYRLIDGKYEYDKLELDGLSSKYIYVPLSVITDTELDIRRVGVFSYLRVHSGLNNIIGFTVPDMVEWFGGKPDRYKNGTNEKTLSTIDFLTDRGYITYLTEKSKSSYMKCRLDLNHCIAEGKDGGYSVLYLDELEKILSYKKSNSKDNTINGNSILLTFAFLRGKIIRRQNELKPEERFPEGIKDRRERLPEAYGGNINDIAAEIGISSKTLSKIIDILEYELEMIVTDRAYRVKNEDNEFRTLPTIFANAYKRDDKYLLLTGDDYSREEIQLKAENMKQYYQGYKIDKKKRKNKVK